MFKRIYDNDLCPDCHAALEKKGYQERTVIDTDKNKANEILYKCEKKQCPKCRKVFSPKPKVLDKELYGNNLVAQACVMHYYHGIPIGRIEAMLGKNISSGSLFSVFHRVASILEKTESDLINDLWKFTTTH